MPFAVSRCHFLGLSHSSYGLCAWHAGSSTIHVLENRQRRKLKPWAKRDIEEVHLAGTRSSTSSLDHLTPAMYGGLTGLTIPRSTQSSRAYRHQPPVPSDPQCLFVSHGSRVTQLIHRHSGSISLCVVHFSSSLQPWIAFRSTRAGHRPSTTQRAV